MNIPEIQTALKKQGFDPGGVDGVWGRRTIAALRAFQRAKGLDAIGQLGPKTLAALRASAAPAVAGVVAAPAEASPLVWFAEAQRLQGLREVAGPGSNPVIMNWADDLDLHYKDDDVPWCGLFVSHCIGATLPEESLPNNPLGARSWLKFGVECEPALGAVIVFWRESRNGAKGHVGFYNGEDAEAYHVLGGNQSNAVNVTRIAKDRFLGTRRPASVPELPAGRVQRTPSGATSQNEA